MASNQCQFSTLENLPNRVPTRVSLVHRGIQINSLLCTLCLHHDEDKDHFFARFAFARIMWSQVGFLAKILISPSNSFGNIMDTTSYGLKNDTTHQKIVDSLFKATLWSI